MAKPFLPNLEIISATGIMPGFGAVRQTDQNNVLQCNLKKQLRLKDEQEFLNRYEWFNLPDIKGVDIERMLYFRGQIMGFFMESNRTFYFLPFALDGKNGNALDVYGRYCQVTPVPMGPANQSKKDEERPWIAGLTFKVCHTEAEDETEEEWRRNISTRCAILRDYTPQLAQNVIPRAVLQESIIDMQSELLPMMRTSLMNNTGTKGVKVSSEDEASNVKAANYAKIKASLNGEQFIPIVGKVDFQEMDSAGSSVAGEFLQSFQAVDNIRSGFMGLGSGLSFQKQAHMLQTEADMNQSTTDMVLQDGLQQRQHFCNIFNSIFGTSIWCEIKSHVDMNNAPGETETDAMNDNQIEQGGNEDVDE